MRFERPKPGSASVTLAKANLLKFLQIGVATVNMVGISAILNLIPARHQAMAGLSLIIFDVGAAMAGVDGAGKIASERRLRKTVFTPPGQVGVDAEDSQTGAFMSNAEFARFKKVQPFIEAGIDLVLTEAANDQRTKQPSIMAGRRISDDLKASMAEAHKIMQVEGMAQAIEAVDDESFII